MTIPQALALGLRHHQAGRLAEAQAIYRQILAVQPAHAEAMHLIGVIANQVGRPDLALMWFRQATTIAPDYAAAHNNLGGTLQKIGQLEEAISAYHRALELQPNFAEAYCNLGDALRESGNLDGAVDALNRALHIRPDLVEAYLHLAAAAAGQGHMAEAESAYRSALRLQPNQPAAHSSLICALLLQPGLKHRIMEEQNSWNDRFGRPPGKSIPAHMNDRSPDRRLRLGYVSADFREHAIAWNLMPLFRNHDRSRVEIFCYSGVARPDSITDEFRRETTQWRNTANVDDEAFAEMVRGDGIDILVDLAQHTVGNRLTAFARKPAPVQVSFAGYPEGTGLDAIKYRISDHWLEGDGKSTDFGFRIKSSVLEQLFLIDSFWCYDSVGLNVTLSELPAVANSRITFGSLNNCGKVNEPLLRIWAQVLASVRDSRLILLSPPGSHREQIIHFLAECEVRSDRIEFVTPRPRKEYLELYHRLDIVLDTFPYNGHTTSLDALWMGVPVVSLCGERPVSRAGLSQLSNLGLPELVAFTEDQYVEIATRLANDIPRLKELRATLRQRMETSVLMDGARFARQIEACYRWMWREWCASQGS